MSLGLNFAITPAEVDHFGMAKAIRKIATTRTSDTGSKYFEEYIKISLTQTGKLNIHFRFLKVIQELKQQRDIVVKKADKTGKTVV
ncbi:hypothetical protein GJ496_005013 [Pomphorhynchus laevis]|nr:hypothetical protein GJ496_005013 [Pomphorhynchus laevis]